MSERPTVAIACQGGGSLTAYTAGVLAHVAEHADVDVVALSGTSGGAMCAALAWDGLAASDPERAVANLRSFWEDIGTNGPADQLVNQSIVGYATMEESGLPTPELSPYANPFASWGQRRLRRTIDRYVDFDGRLDDPDRPGLYVGAVDITEDRFRVFQGGDVSPDAVVASAAVPSLFPAVEIDGTPYWDGLLSENPPVRSLTYENPDEIWVVQVDGPDRPSEPRTMKEIADRRNVLAGNLSLNQELRFIETINEMLAEGAINAGNGYVPIDIERLVLDEPLGYAAKLNRDADFLADLFEGGVGDAESFLESRTHV